MAPRIVRVDPRDYHPQLRGIMSDLAVEIWNDDPYCLCGCGRRTLRNRSGDGPLPIGAFRFWVAGHATRAPWYDNNLARMTPQQKATRLERARKDTVNAAALSIMLYEWSRSHQLKDMARSTGLTISYLSMIANYRRKKVGRAAAARILIALGEDLRPEMAAAHANWLRHHRENEWPD